MIINESAENYLETILILSNKLPVVRSVDIAMKNLKSNGHITVTDAGFIYLTESGREIAEKVYERHRFISSWLISLGVPEDIATEDACKMEHIISNESYAAIKDYIKANTKENN